MFPCVFLALVLLTAQDPAPALPDGAPAATAEPSASDVALTQKYEEMRDKTAETAAAQWKLAQWCEQNGLKAESFVHYGKVVELDPRRDAAWQKLGFKKHDGRWMTVEQIADDEAQTKVDKEWAPKLKAWHKTIHGHRKPEEIAEAQAALDAIEDPGATPSIYREFCGGSAVDQSIGVQILSQIQGPIASKAIAAMAVYGKSPTVRRHATEVLRGRPPEEFLDMLVALMKDLIKYETRPVGGPGSPGVLFVEGERFNARRFYAPPTPPRYVPRMGDMISYDANGQPVVSRTTVLGSVGDFTSKVPGAKGLLQASTFQFTNTETYAIGAAQNQAEQAARSAQQQLANDIAQIEAVNTQRRSFNDLVMGAAQAATGQNPGWTAQDWRGLIASARTDQSRTDPKPKTHRSKPTLDQMVPLAYLPDLSASLSRQSSTRFISQFVPDH